MSRRSSVPSATRRSVSRGSEPSACSPQLATSRSSWASTGSGDEGPGAAHFAHRQHGLEQGGLRVIGNSRGQHGSTTSEPDRQVKSIHQQVVVLPEIECRHVVGVIETDLGTDHDQVVELMADPDGVAGVVGREA